MLKNLLINQLAPGEVDRTGERVDGKATIIGKLGYNWIAVLDAEYRINTVMYVPNGYVPTMHGVTQTTYSNPTTGMSAAELLATVPVDFLTSKQTNYAYLGEATSSLPNLPVSHCTGISINGTTASMPNIQTLCFVWSRRDFVDEHDPTLSSYSTQGLTSWGSDSYTKAAGSSTQIYAGTAGTSYFMVNASGRILINGYDSGASTQIIPILEIPAYEDRTGERIDNKATIIGKLGDNWIAVLDAAYRGIAEYSTENIDISAGIPFITGKYNARSSSSEEFILAQQLYDTHSSKWNTDYLIQTQDATKFPAAKMCYDIMIDGKHAQLGNIQTMAFVFAKKDFVDANDPTASSHQIKKLSNWGFGSTGSRASVITSSTIDNVSNASEVYANVTYGTCQGQSRTIASGVCPILEIPLYKDRTGERVDNKATIVGKLGRYWIAALDSIFRSQYVWSTEGNTTSSNFLSGTVTNFDINCGEAVFLNDSFLKDRRTSAEATSSARASQPAFKACLDTKLLGKDCALPTIQTMAFLRSWGTFVDSIDPTVTNPGYDIALGRAISYWTSSFPGGTSDKAYISVINGSSLVLKSRELNVCPICEIPLWCDDNYK